MQRCETLHVLKSADGQPGAILAVYRNAPDQPERLSITVPVAALVAEPAMLELPSGDMRALPFRLCLPRGCLADIAVAPADLETLAKSASATVHWKDALARDVKMTVSWKGLPAALAHARSKQAATASAAAKR